MIVAYLEYPYRLRPAARKLCVGGAHVASTRGSAKVRDIPDRLVDIQVAWYRLCRLQKPSDVSYIDMDHRVLTARFFCTAGGSRFDACEEAAFLGRVMDAFYEGGGARPFDMVGPFEGA